MLEPRLAYLAGFFDGEGCVGIKKPSPKQKSHTPYVTVSQVRPEVLLIYKREFGGNVRFSPTSAKNGIWCWQIAGMKRVLHFLAQIEPHLIVKRAEALAVVEAFQHRVRAKKRGVPATIVAIREAARLRVMGMR